MATTSAAGRIHGLDRVTAESVVAGRTKGFWLPLTFGLAGESYVRYVLPPLVRATG